MPHFLDEIEVPVAWLRQVTVRLAVSRLRRRAVWTQLKQILGAADVAAHADGRAGPAGSDTHLDLTAAIRRLSPSARGAIVLHYYFAADYREIAAALGLRESSVGKTLARAREALRADLQ